MEYTGNAILIAIPGSGTGIDYISGNYHAPYGGYYFDGFPISRLVLHFNKYFPYDNGNGQPIYDENNGNQLRDPVTGI